MGAHESEAKQEKKGMGRERNSRGASPAAWELEGSGDGGVFGGGGCGRTWGRAGRRRGYGPLGLDSSEERRERR